jgi:hypothetical protein
MEQYELRNEQKTPKARDCPMRICGPGEYLNPALYVSSRGYTFAPVLP